MQSRVDAHTNHRGQFAQACRTVGAEVDNQGASLEPEDLLYLNGVDALTGGPLRDAPSVEQVVAMAEAEFAGTARADREELRALSDLKSRVDYGMDVDHLDDPGVARWGVIVAEGEKASIGQALKPLIDHRAAQMGSEPKLLEVGPETTAVQFLRDNGVERGMGVVDNVPYYLLIAADPQKVSFRFQMELNTEYATGRLDFDSPDGYDAYARHLVEYETGQSTINRREAVFWAPERPVDPATSKSAPQLVQPLYDQLDPKSGFGKRLFRGDEDSADSKPATKENLHSILSGSQLPAFLFTASHGMGYKKAHPHQTEQQGALLCQEYLWNTQIDSGQWYGANDLIKTGADLRGLVHFAFACFGAGTPQHDDYAPPDAPAPIIADRPFVAALPRAILARGALAFIGHVEMAWGYSFMAPQPMAPPNGITPLEAFQRALRRILYGDPIAYALRDQYDRGLQLSSSLLETIAFKQRNQPVSAAALAQMWTERNDARAYLLVGDPAARLRVDLLGQDGRPSSSAIVSKLPGSPSGSEVSPDVSVPMVQPDVPSQPDTTPPVAHEEEAAPSFLPLQVTGRDEAVDKELLVAWKDYMKEGFKQNNRMFKRVLRAFVVPYWLTVAMYVVLFLFGLSAFGLAAALAVQQELGFAAIFGGLSAATFLTFFISRPLRSLEQNVILITWLGIVYNTYWSQLMNATNPQTIQKDLEAITRTTLKDLRALATAQGKLSSQRPDLPDPDKTPLTDAK
jgi:hypothetical protein